MEFRTRNGPVFIRSPTLPTRIRRSGSPSGISCSQNGRSLPPPTWTTKCPMTVFCSSSTALKHGADFPATEIESSQILASAELNEERRALTLRQVPAVGLQSSVQTWAQPREASQRRSAPPSSNSRSNVGTSEIVSSTTPPSSFTDSGVGATSHGFGSSPPGIAPWCLEGGLEIFEPAAASSSNARPHGMMPEQKYASFAESPSEYSRSQEAKLCGSTRSFPGKQHHALGSHRSKSRLGSALPYFRRRR